MDCYEWIDPFEEIERRARQGYSRGLSEGEQRGRDHAVRALSHNGYAEGLAHAARKLGEQAMGRPEIQEAIAKVASALKCHAELDGAFRERLDAADTMVVQRVVVRPFAIDCGLRLDRW